MDASRAEALEIQLLALKGDVYLLDTIVDDALASQAWQALDREKLKGHVLFLLNNDQDNAVRQAVDNVRRDMRTLLETFYGKDGEA